MDIGVVYKILIKFLPHVDNIKQIINHIMFLFKFCKNNLVVYTYIIYKNQIIFP